MYASKVAPAECDAAKMVHNGDFQESLLKEEREVSVFLPLFRGNRKLLPDQGQVSASQEGCGLTSDDEGEAVRAARHVLKEGCRQVISQKVRLWIIARVRCVG